MNSGLSAFSKTRSEIFSVMKLFKQITACLLLFALSQSVGLGLDYDKYPDLSETPKYRDIAGKTFRLRCDFWVFAYATFEYKRNGHDGIMTDGPLYDFSITAYDGPAYGSAELVYYGRIPKGTIIKINRTIELPPPFGHSVYWVEILNPPSDKYASINFRIAQSSRLKNYSHEKYPSGARRLNDAFFEEITDN